MKRFSQKIKRRTFFWQIFLSLGSGFILFTLLFFLGLPLLAKLSLFFGKFRWSEETATYLDHTPPSSPQLESLVSATNSARITVRGISEPGSNVKIYFNNQMLESVLVGKDGVFTKRITLEEGENKILARAIDQSGNESALSTTVHIFLKKTGPFLEIEFPQEEELETDEKEIEIKGKTTSEVHLTVNNRVVPVKSGGFFSYLVSLSEGENLIKVIATDDAGNETTAERKIIFSAKP